MSQVKQLTDAAKRYLKNKYDEDTVSMTVSKNEVLNGNGELYVDCTVRYTGTESDWSKIFTFREGKVVYMSARRR